MYISNDGMSVHGPVRSEEETVSDNQAGARRTHIEDKKDPVELDFPGDDCFPVIPHVKRSRGCTPFAMFDDLVLYFRDGPGIESMISRTRNCNIAGPTHVVN